MRLIFSGTPAFALAALERLHAAGHEIALVLTQPDRPAGRGLKLQPSPVKQFALAHGLPLAQPRGLRLAGKFSEDAQAARASIEAVRADAMVVAAYGLILPQWALDTPALGCLNIHASLLPRWRGAAPIQRAIEAGDARTGVTIMQMDAGLDTGDLLLAESVAIGADDSAGSLHDVLAGLGAELIAQALERVARGELKPEKQSEAGATYANKIDRHEAALDWSQDATQIERKLRAFDPSPGATARFGGTVIKLWRAEVDDAAGAPVAAPPGTIIDANDAGVLVACGGSGVLRLTELQRAGARRMSAADFLRGFALAAGASFEPRGV